MQQRVLPTPVSQVFTEVVILQQPDWCHKTSPICSVVWTSENTSRTYSPGGARCYQRSLKTIAYLTSEKIDAISCKNINTVLSFYTIIKNLKFKRKQGSIIIITYIKSKEAS